MKLVLSLLTALITLARTKTAVLAVTANEIIQTYLNVTLGESCSLDELTGIFCIVGVVINTLLGFAGAAAVIFLVIGGLQYTVSGGDEKALTAAKGTITYAVLGMIIILFAIAAINYLLTFLLAPA